MPPQQPTPRGSPFPSSRQAGGGGSRRQSARAGGGGGGALKGGYPGADGGGGGDAEVSGDGPKPPGWDGPNLMELITAAEREGGYTAARRIFEEKVQQHRLPPGQLWRAHLELAESAKRGASLANVRHHFAQALHAEPRTVQVWLEACRTLDELGELEECRALLARGVDICPQSEQLCLKLTRIHERLGAHDELRALAGSMRHEQPERTCKVLLDAAHFEVRAGNGEAARAFLRCLMQRMPHQGPVYCEACRIESILGHTWSALSIAEHGVQTCLKYSPLWFILLRLAEKAYGANSVKEYATYAVKNICHELHWKIHFEVAAAFSREGRLSECRRSIGLAALCCPKHLRWKVWLLAARSELWEGSEGPCRKMLAQARAEAPSRIQVAVCIERVRTEEYLGAHDEARAALAEAHACDGQDWKVYLEHIFLEARQGNLSSARDVALEALQLHPATGRLWSAFVALEHSGEGGARIAMETFRRAVKEVPKSGEVWCEGARVYMNPLGAFFHLGHACKCLEFAVHLTPQYGDSFLELLRLRLLLELRSRIRNNPLTLGLLGPETEVNGTVPPATPPGVTAAQVRAIAVLVTQRICLAIAAEMRSGRPVLSASSGKEDGAMHRNGAKEAWTQDRNGSESGGMPCFQLSQLELLCTYADPNYGFLWFWCRDSFLSTPREVLCRMHQEVGSDLVAGGTLWAYAWAIARGVFGLPAGDQAAQPPAELQAALAKEGGGARRALAPREFATGSLALSLCFASSSASLEQESRRRLIFGSDILCV
mmetsp:Transcript_36067/g.92941  ORF Transcript_36067/g.92941 Transcript_36067/m.92941 type:complete len:774 (+) Transcript_36067:25-2346(+)